MLRRRPRQAVTLDGRLSFTGNCSALLVLPGTDSLVLSPDPYRHGDDPTSPTLDRLADELTTRGRFYDVAEAVAETTLGMKADEEMELVPVRVTIERLAPASR